MMNCNESESMMNDLLIWGCRRTDSEINMALSSLNAASSFSPQEIAIPFAEESFIRLVIDIVISENRGINFQ